MDRLEVGDVCEVLHDGVADEWHSRPSHTGTEVTIVGIFPWRQSPISFDPLDYDVRLPDGQIFMASRAVLRKKRPPREEKGAWAQVPCWQPRKDWTPTRRHELVEEIAS
jgi:hypothetical protein